MRFIRPTSLNSIPISIQITEELCKVIAFIHAVTLNEGQGHLYQNAEFISSYFHTKFKLHQFINDWMRVNACQRQCFFMQSVQQQQFPLIQVLIEKGYQDVHVELPQYHIQFHLNQLKSVRESEAKRFAFCQPCTPKHGQGLWTGCKMLEINGAYKHGTFKKNGSKVCEQCPRLKFLPC